MPREKIFGIVYVLKGNLMILAGDVGNVAEITPPVLSRMLAIFFDKSLAIAATQVLGIGIRGIIMFLNDF